MQFPGKRGSWNSNCSIWLTQRTQESARQLCWHHLFVVHLGGTQSISTKSNYWNSVLHYCNNGFVGFRYNPETWFNHISTKGMTTFCNKLKLSENYQRREIISIFFVIFRELYHTTYGIVKHFTEPLRRVWAQYSLGFPKTLWHSVSIWLGIKRVR